MTHAGFVARHRRHMRRWHLSLCATLLTVLSACATRAVVECGDIDGAACERVASALRERVPEGFDRLIIIGGFAGRVAPPYPAVVCYPDGSFIKLAVTVIEPAVEIIAWDGLEQLPDCE